MRLQTYARLSNEEENCPSVANQLKEGAEWIGENDHEPIGEYADDGWSGEIRHRPGLDRLLSESKELRSDGIVIRDWYRLGRGRKFARLMDEIEDDYRLKVFCLTGLTDEEVVVDLKGVVVGGEFVRSTRKVVTSHMLKKAGRAEYTGGRQLCGYRWVDPNPPETYAAKARGEKVVLIPKKERIIVPEEAALIFEVYRLADPQGENLPLAEISRRTGMELQRVRRVLRHPGYAGAYTYGRMAAVRGRHNVFRSVPRDRWQVAWGKHPPIIPRELWDRCQERLDYQASRRPLNDGKASLALSGLIRCGECGTPLRVSGRYTDPRGAYRYYYRCPMESCPGIGRIETQGWTESLVALVLCELAREDFLQIVSEELHRAYKAGVRHGTAKAEIRRLEQSRDRLVDAIASGEVGDTSALRRKLNEIQRTLESQRRPRIDDRRSASPAMTATALRAKLMRALDALAALQSTPGLEKAARPLLHRLVREIRIWRGKEDGEVIFRVEALTGLTSEHIGWPILMDLNCLRATWRLPRRAA